MTIEATDNMAKARAAKVAKQAARETATRDIEAIEEKPLTEEEIERKRADLYAAIADLPPVNHPGLRPGTRVGEGLKAEYVSFTHAWFEDVEARRKDRNDQGGLIWPTYSLREITPAQNETYTVNGVSYAIYAGLQCKLPDPHFHAYLNRQKALRQSDIDFAKPDVPRDANAMTPPHKMADGPIRDRQT